MKKLKIGVSKYICGIILGLFYEICILVVMVLFCNDRPSVHNVILWKRAALKSKVNKRLSSYNWNINQLKMKIVSKKHNFEPCKFILHQIFEFLFSLDELTYDFGWKLKLKILMQNKIYQFQKTAKHIKCVFFNEKCCVVLL